MDVMRNFDYLKEIPEFAQLYSYCDTAEICQSSDPAKSALHCRCALEYMVRVIYNIKIGNIRIHYIMR
jgi:hypothetical protein